MCEQEQGYGGESGPVWTKEAVKRNKKTLIVVYVTLMFVTEMMSVTSQQQQEEVNKMEKRFNNIKD